MSLVDELSRVYLYDLDLAKAITNVFNYRLRLLAWRFRARE